MARDLGIGDLFDRELARHLGDAAGSLPDTNVALASMRSRVVNARRRRTRYALAALVVGIVGAGSALAVESRRSMTVAPTDPAPTGSAVPVAPTEHSTTSTTAAPTTSTPPPAPPPSTAPAPTEPAPPPATATDEPPPVGEPGDAGDSDAGAPNAAPAPAVQTITSAGGAITIQVIDQHLALTGVQPAAAWYVARQEAGPERIVVTFASAHLASTIRVALIDGRAQPEVVEGDGRGAGGGGGWHDGDGGRDGGWPGTDPGAGGPGDPDGGWPGGDPDGRWPGGDRHDGGDGGWSGRDDGGWSGGDGHDGGGSSGSADGWSTGSAGGGWGGDGGGR